MNNFGRNLALWVVIAILLITLFQFFQPEDQSASSEIPFSKFLEEVESGQVAEVTIMGNQINGKGLSGEFTSYAPNDVDLVPVLTENGVEINAAPSEEGMPSIFGILLSWFPMLLLIGVWIFFMRQMQGGGGKAMGFGRSKARLLTEKQGRVTFEDVAGIDEAKDELEEIVEFLKNPQKFQRLGGKIPKGVLLVGPPGTGKTLLARAIAGEANVPFYTISGSDFVEMFVGVGASRVRDMFEQSKKNAPCIIFIDEIDAVGSKRYDSSSGGEKEVQRTMLELLNQLDGFDSRSDVKVIMATNKIESLDPALIRPGRIDRKIEFPFPDEKTKRRIFQIHTSKMSLAEDVNLEEFIMSKDDLTGADIKALCSESGLIALRERRMKVKMADFRKSKDKVLYRKKGNIPEGLYI